MGGGEDIKSGGDKGEEEYKEGGTQDIRGGEDEGEGEEAGQK